jgi:hypothetical protein
MRTILTVALVTFEFPINILKDIPEPSIKLDLYKTLVNKLISINKEIVDIRSRKKKNEHQYPRTVKLTMISSRKMHTNMILIPSTIASSLALIAITLISSINSEMTVAKLMAIWK